MEKGCGSAAVAVNGQTRGKLPPNPYFARLRKISYARVGRSSLAAIRYQSANDLSPKTIVNILETIFAVLRYAKKSGMRTDMDTHRPVEMAALIGQVE
jgi:hypothetical protein